MQTSTKALDKRGYPADSVAAHIKDVGPDVDHKLWAWWMTLHTPDSRPNDSVGFRRYYERVYEDLENSWAQKR